jgi:CDP-6-deoxy-D-xylo-4-hexulose-3-dehydrase
MTANDLKADILAKVTEYYRLVHAPKQEAPFQAGTSRVQYAGRMFDEREMV